MKNTHYGMSMPFVVGGVILLVLVVGALFLFSGDGEPTQPTVATGTVMDDDATLVDDDAVMREGDVMMEDGGHDDGDSMGEGSVPKTDDAVMKAEAGSYEEYSAEKVVANDGAVLFFHATWCPSCKALNADIEKNVADIPAGVTILKTDYDEHTALKQKYGVTTQHTMVQVDADGNMIKKWSGSATLSALLGNVQ